MLILCGLLQSQCSIWLSLAFGKEGQSREDKGFHATSPDYIALLRSRSILHSPSSLMQASWKCNTYPGVGRLLVIFNAEKSVFGQVSVQTSGFGQGSVPIMVSGQGSIPTSLFG